MIVRNLLKKVFPPHETVKVFCLIGISVFIFFSIQVQALEKPILLISDIDDTVKVANTEDTLGLVYHGLFTERIYPGMDTLLNEIVHNENGEKRGDLIFMTNSPEFLRKLRTSFVSAFPFPPHELVLRDWYKYSDAHIYKREEMTARILSTDANVILIGDDTEKDAMVFKDLLDKFPDRISAAYIHEVTGKSVSKGIRKFTHSLDIAIQEANSERLSDLQVLKVGNSVLDEKTTSDIIPDFKFCPKSHVGAMFNSVTEKQGSPIRKKIESIHSKIRTLIQKTCAKRGGDD